MKTTHPLGDAPIGQQLLVHFEKRNAVRHATSLFPSSWAEFLSPFRKMRAQAEQQSRANQNGRNPVCQAN